MAGLVFETYRIEVGIARRFDLYGITIPYNIRAQICFNVHPSSGSRSSARICYSRGRSQTGEIEQLIEENAIPLLSDLITLPHEAKTREQDNVFFFTIDLTEPAKGEITTHEALQKFVEGLVRDFESCLQKAIDAS